jgi:hypothetical protein
MQPLENRKVDRLASRSTITSPEEEAMTTTTTQTTEHRRLGAPDEVRSFNHGQLEQLPIEMADGTSHDARPGVVTSLPSGHDAWVVGDADVVVDDWYGASEYAR